MSSLYKRRFGLNPSLENAEGEGQTTVDVVPQVETGGLDAQDVESIAEVKEVSAEGDNLLEEMEVLTAESQGLEAYRAAIESTLSEGGLNPQAALMVQVGLEGFRQRLGLNVHIPSTESFHSSSDRLSLTQLSQEGFKEAAKKIWDGIKNMFKKAWNWVLGLFGKSKKTKEELKAKFEELAKRKIEGKLPDNDDAKVSMSGYLSVFRTEIAPVESDKLKAFFTTNANAAKVSESIPGTSKAFTKLAEEANKAGEAGLNPTNDRRKVFESEFKEVESKLLLTPGNVPESLQKKYEGKKLDGFSISPALFKGERFAKFSISEGEGENAQVTFYLESLAGSEIKTEDFKEKKLSFFGGSDVNNMAKDYVAALEASIKLEENSGKMENAIKEAEKLIDQLAAKGGEGVEEDPNFKTTQTAALNDLKSAQKTIVDLCGKYNSHFIEGAAKVYDFLDKSANAHKA